MVRAACRRFRPDSPTPASRRAATTTILLTRWRSGAMAPSSRGGELLRSRQRPRPSERAHLCRGRGGKWLHGGALRSRRRGGLRRYGVRWRGHADAGLQRAEARPEPQLHVDAGDAERLGLPLLQRSGGPDRVGFGCVVELDLATYAAFTPVVASPLGTWMFTIGVPSDPALLGLTVALQAALFGTAGPLGLDLSNGVIITVGY